MPESKKALSPMAKKAPAKKAAAKESPEKKSAPRKRAVKTPEISVIVEHHNRQIGTEAIAETAKKLWALAGHDVAEVKKIELYVKQEDGAVYCVVNGEPVGRYDL
ncbi:conserved hypothetical protein [uncultured Eubacteriales bacterium]|uniref:Uncharacterized protein n=1 Tax=uncultured Eubacteriales bacterium TaxID=172733 RepID=A0A212JHW3_9FIRM|nr:conserved hypothetical protein [uncultured Eubacteriales bacterium]